MLKMLRSADGAADPKGKMTRHYESGKVYGEKDILPDVAHVFLAQGWAEEVKDAGPAPENKALNGAPENKGVEPTAQGEIRKGPGGHYYRHDEQGNRIGNALSQDALRFYGM